MEVVSLDDLHGDALLTLSRLYFAEHRDDEALRYSVKAADLMRGHRATYRAQRTKRACCGAGASRAPRGCGQKGIPKRAMDDVAGAR